MGKGLRIIMALCPDGPVVEPFDEIGALTVWCCRHCLRPIETAPFVDGGGWSYECPEHGQIGVMLDGGDLDLGLVRDNVQTVDDESSWPPVGNWIPAGVLWDDRLLERTPHPSPLDLGLRRDTSALARNDFQMFNEEWVGLRFDVEVSRARDSEPPDNPESETPE